jgi:hypothetical protein
VSVQVSFRKKADAVHFARQIDWLKSRAALAGITLSDVLLDAVLDAEPEVPEEQP